MTLLEQIVKSILEEMSDEVKKLLAKELEEDPRTCDINDIVFSFFYSKIWDRINGHRDLTLELLKEI